MLDRLDAEDAEHFAQVRALLDRAGVAYELDATLVRGLDYYTRTVFEFECDRLGAQSAVGGGGRYDGLIEQLGGPPTPASGWALGIERILAWRSASPRSPRAGRLHRRRAEARERALTLAIELRRRRDRRRPRPRRALAQGPDEAGRPVGRRAR